MSALIARLARADDTTHAGAARENEIRTILKHVAHLEAAIDSIGDGDDLYEAGLSSLDTIQLMLAIEKQFNIEIPDEMLNRNLFRSIDALADTIATLQRTEHSA
ncbi:acyl carrier protein [Burkholderia sp. E168m23]|uniref:acyl carrier protein n=1 Tax=Burkholderia sp. E168m23 TaxID=1561200 RepID=UPI001F3D90F5|nr:acyl carrier protein [Burkholderia sp. E168m23]